MLRVTKAWATGRLVALLLLVALLAGHMGPALAQGPSQDDRLALWNQTLDDAAVMLRGPGGMLANLSQTRAELEELARAAQAMADELAQRATPSREQLEALGEAPEDPASENDSLAGDRRKLQTTLAQLEGRKKKAELLATRARNLANEAALLQLKRFRAQILERGPLPALPSSWAIFIGDMHQTAQVLIAEARLRMAELREAWSLAHAVAAIVFWLVLASACVWLHNMLLALIAQRTMVDSRSPGSLVLLSLGSLVTRLVLPLVPVFVGHMIWRWPTLGGSADLPFLPVIGTIPLAVAGMYALAYTMCAPQLPALRVIGGTDVVARRVARSLFLLSLIFAADQALQDIGDYVRWDTATYGVANLFAVLAASWLFARIARLSGIQLGEQATQERGTALDEAADDDDESEDEDEEEDEDEALARRLIRSLAPQRLIGVLALFAAFIIPVTAIFGYFALSRFLLTRIIASWALIAAAVLVFGAVQTVGRLIAARNASASGWENEPTEAPWWMTIMALLALVCAVVPLMMLTWGADVQDLSLLGSRLLEGFRVGSIHIAPGPILLAILLFLVGLGLTRVVQAFLQIRVLRRTKLDAGARNSITSGLGYIGVGIAVLAAFAAAGLDLSNLALVAGALSVGIGFGLQTIVNNFVSGIILLIERPFKVGDWIVVGGQHGTVKRIKVRATEIDTFDRATLTVPNSELVSTTVTNWTHRSLIGRMIVTVRAPFDCDPRAVEHLLEEVVRGHPMVLRRPRPYILLTDFGDNALIFEIRAYLRDINWVLNVQSDVRHEVFRRFREAGIKMPFPQQEILLRRPPAGEGEPARS